MRGLALMVASLFLQPSPASELNAAVTDAAQVAPINRPFVRYLTLYAVPDDRREDVLDVANFWVNSLSRRRTITKLSRVNETLLRLDVRDYGWPVEVWEALVDGRGYEFKPLWGNVKGTVNDPIGTRSPIMRAEAFVSYASDHPFYTMFLSLPGNIKDVLTDQRIREEDIAALRLELAGAKIRSPVALHNRRLVRWPTLTGYFWKSDDHLTDFGDDSVVENVLKTDVDAGEFIWSLPNGLQAYYIAGKDGKLARVVPADIAQDYQTPAKDKQIYNARSCVGCHSSGINAFRDDIAKMIESTKVELRSKDKEKALALEERYLGELPAEIVTDQKRYSQAVWKACDRSPEEIASAFTLAVVDYRESPITADIAARELGVTREQLSDLAIQYGPDNPVRGTYAALLSGETVPRQAWEAVIAEASYILASKRAVK